MRQRLVVALGALMGVLCWRIDQRPAAMDMLFDAALPAGLGPSLADVHKMAGDPFEQVHHVHDSSDWLRTSMQVWVG